MPMTTATTSAEDYFGLLAEAATDHAIIILNTHGDIAAWSAGARQATGWDEQEALGRHYAFLFDTSRTQARTEPAAPLAQAMQHGKLRLEQALQRKDGQPLHGCATLYRLPAAGGQCRGYGLIVDMAAPILAIAADAREPLDHRIRESQQRAELATEAAGLGIWVWDVDNDKGTWENERMFELFGVPVTADPLNYKRFQSELAHPDDLPALREALSACVEGKARLHYEGRFFRGPERELRWVEFIGELRGGDTPGKRRVIGTAADITDRKFAHTALLEAQARIDAILMAGEIATWTIDIQQQRIRTEQRPGDMPVVAESHLCGTLHEHFNAIHESERAAVAMQMENAIHQGTRYQAAYRVRSTRGGLRHVIARGRVEYAEDGTPMRLTGALIDITRQKHAEAALRASQERYRALFESIDEGFCLIEMLFDQNGKPCDYRFLETNPAFEKHTGLSDTIGKTVLELAPGQDQHWFDQYGHVAMTGQPLRFVNESTPLQRWYDVYASRFGDPANRHVAVLFNDITARHRAEQALKRAADELAESDRRKTEFLATLAHELRNPLAPIRTGLDIMRINGGNPATMERVQGIMQRQITQMAHLIDDLLDISRINSGKVVLQRQAMDLRETLSSLVETMQPQVDAAGHMITLKLPREPMPVQADATRIMQIFGNLLNNAIKYTPKGGRILISARRLDGHMEVAVADTGVGIPRESLQHVFDMFTQIGRNMGQAQGGLGIGLSLVRSLVEMHGGTVRADSEGPDLGSTFTVVLPSTAPVEAPRPPPTHVPADAAARRLRVLVADDNRDAALTLAELLELHGYVTTVAHDGHKALECAKTFRPDVAFLDIGMPGMDGYATAGALRQTKGLDQLMLVALTGWAAAEDRERSALAGFNLHLKKPVDTETLLELLAGVQQAADCT
ncbi:PAS domain S-box protein [Herbaspirillum sp. LeCh32-8]|uniref:PAS domain-containing hybrid sensor histidine kinase/response regulator n=1 Tax=Herbaspirillum sp. LeCh32-8 TaxID=2821356 RepID=UPI001AE38485|nr:PAS domain S-box protein [Herbaspirillum sp. LeCh32-8]MBP0599200.1 PAS domain S-box protein [Herbaspirillum sp. LeCh32-8]